MLIVYLVQPQRAQLCAAQHLSAVGVVLDRSWFRGVLHVDVRDEALLHELKQSGDPLSFADAHFALGKPCTMRGFHISGRVLVLLSGGLPYRFAVEGELVPVDLISFVDGHCLTVLSFLLLVSWPSDPAASVLVDTLRACTALVLL